MIFFGVSLNIFGMAVSSQIFWLAAVVIFIIIEALSVGLVTIWFAFGAILAMVASMLGLGFVWQFVIFCASSLFFLFATRPFFKKYIASKNIKTNAESVIGKKGFVIEEISQTAYGQVKVSAQVWTAKAENASTIAKGSEVEVLAIEGVKLIVRQVN